jgi:hypothetical protein
MLTHLFHNVPDEAGTTEKPEAASGSMPFGSLLTRIIPDEFL